MAEPGATDPFAAFSEMIKAWTPLGMAAPEQLRQSILQGWSFISVNEGNSAAPDTEQAIVAKASYGRQLGRILDAVEALIAERPADAKPDQAFTDLHDLAIEIDAAKRDAARARIARLRSDLSMLKRDEPEEFLRQKSAILDLFDRPSR